MKRTLVLSPLIPGIRIDSDITFSLVPAFFGTTTKSLKMTVMRPFEPSPTPLPCIVWLCGGAWMTMDRNLHLANFTDCVRSGIIIASLEYRTSGEGQFPCQLEDIKAGVRFLKAHAKEWGIDPQRIGIMGESAGGHLAALVGTTNGMAVFEKGSHLDFDSHVVGVCAWYPPVDLHLTGSNQRGVDPFHGIPPQNLLLGGDVTKDPALADRANPKTYLRTGCPPFLLLHGDADEVVPLEHSQGLYDALQTQGTPVDFYVLQGVGHGSIEFFQEETQSLILEFFQKVFGQVGRCAP